MSERHQLGHATLELLAEDWSVPVIRELLQGPLRPSELEERLRYVPHSALMRRLAAMRRGGIVDRERRQGLPPHARYSLTRQGRLVLEILEAAVRWERRWRPCADHGGSGEDRGRSALRLMADERNRELLLALAAGPVSPKELEARLPGSPRTLRRRLARLVASRILARGADQGDVTYELTEGARHLARVGAAAARWEWQWTKPEGPVPADNLAAVMHLFAPVASIPDELVGSCTMHVEDDPNGSDVYLAAAHGRLAALAGSPDRQMETVCHGTPQGWTDALLLSRLCGITTTGRRTLVAAMLASLSAALFA